VTKKRRTEEEGRKEDKGKRRIMQEVCDEIEKEGKEGRK
jgi:hypothetical protein